MKPWISITSLSLNGLFLIATLVALLTRPDESVPAEAGTGTGPAVAPVPEVKPFHWDQIDAPDFAQFVNNLRGIGCPESIIQTIVKAELEQVYVEKRRELEQRLSSTSAATDAADEFKKLEAEQTAVFAGLMAESMGSSPESPNPASAAVLMQDAKLGSASAFQAFQEPVDSPQAASAATLVPAAFAVGNDPRQAPVAGAGNLSRIPSDPSLDPATSQVISVMRDDFAQSVESSGADPTSEAYRLSWLNAQRSSDERFSSMFGGDAFVRAQLRAVQEAAAAPKGSK